MSRGIDYGLGKTNVDVDTGIRFGVIPANDVGQTWYDSAESEYGEPACPKCGGSLLEHGDENAPEYLEIKDYYCPGDDKWFHSEDCYSDSPQSHTLDDGEYVASQGGDDSDIFITKSPYFTRAAYCSPCAPGACHLRNPCDDGDRAYCFGHDWFEDGVAPYPVYSVETQELIQPTNT